MERMADIRAPLAGFLLGAAGMFAVMYSTQAILPELSREFGVSAAEAGLTVSIVIVVLAAGAWVWGPLSDRWGRKRTLVLASALVAPPTLASALAPSFEVLLVCRALQGLCMPGLLTVGAPYVVEVFGPRLGGRAMGLYITALVSGGIVGRVGVALAAAAVDWRWPIGALSLLPAAGAVLMARTLPEAPSPPSTAGRWDAVRRLTRNRGLQQATAAASALFFAFVGVFSFVTFRLEGPEFHWSQAAGSLIFLMWGLGAIGPLAGAAADRAGWRIVVLGALGVGTAAVVLSLPGNAFTLVDVRRSRRRERDVLQRVLRERRAGRLPARPGLGALALGGRRRRLPPRARRGDRAGHRARAARARVMAGTDRCTSPHGSLRLTARSLRRAPRARRCG
jgi:YNFM family putative membrane transporter